MKVLQMLRAEDGDGRIGDCGEDVIGQAASASATVPLWIRTASVRPECCLGLLKSVWKYLYSLSSILLDTTPERRHCDAIFQVLIDSAAASKLDPVMRRPPASLDRLICYKHACTPFLTQRTMTLPLLH